MRKETPHMPHKPRFFFRTPGGEVGGQQWIFDGDEPIALFERKLIDQPEQILRYFNDVPRPVNLRHLKLRPGARATVSGVQMYWKLNKATITTDVLNFRVEGEGTDRFRMTVVARDGHGIATSRRVLTLTWDADIESYVYDFACHLDIHSPEAIPLRGEPRFEYSDPWYVDIPGPMVEFPGMWRRGAHTHILCEKPDGTVHKMPLNHIGISSLSGAPVRPGGILVPVFEAGNNPAIEFVGDSAAGDHVGVCSWGYDVHLTAHLSHEELYRPIFRRFRIYLCPDDKARRLLDAAPPVPPQELCGMSELPLYERTTSFEKPCALNEAPPGPTDSWPWMPEGEGLSYEKSFGRSDKYSVKISRQTHGLSRWHMCYEGEGGWCEPWPDYIGCRVTGYVKTENVTGAGAGIALRWERYNLTGNYPYAHSERLIGTHDWTPLSVALFGKHPDDCNAFDISLMQDGTGTSWFDDLQVELLHEPLE